MFDFWDGPAQKRKGLSDFDPELIKRSRLEHSRHLRRVLAVFFLIAFLVAPAIVLWLAAPLFPRHPPH